MKYFALLDTEEIIYLGYCEDFSHADSRTPGNTLWIFNEDALRKLVQSAKRSLQTAGIAQR